METISKDILFTIAYYHAQQYPLTTFEVWQLFIGRATRQGVSFSQVIEGLSALAQKKLIVQHRGMWMLWGTAGLPEQRLTRQKIAMQKFRRCVQWARRISWVPFLRALLVTGTLAMKKTSKTSDWDVIVVVKRGRIWIGRLLTTAIMQVMGIRRHDRWTRDRFCLNHFVTEDGLQLEEQNEFSAKEVHFSTALLGGQVHQRFVQENLGWMHAVTPNVSAPQVTSPLCSKAGPVSRMAQGFLEGALEITHVASAVNRLLRRWMIRKIKDNPNTAIPGADIRFSERALVFLPQPKRTKILSEMQEKLTKIVQ